MTDTLPIYEQTLAARYDHPEPTTQRHTENPAMSLAAFEQDVRQHFEDFVTRAKADVAHGEEWLATRLPEVSGLLGAAEANPVVQSVLAAVHVPPSTLAAIASTIDDLEQRFAALTPPPPPPPAAPADPAAGENMHAGGDPYAGAPVVGGQA